VQEIQSASGSGWLCMALWGEKKKVVFEIPIFALSKVVNV